MVPSLRMLPILAALSLLAPLSSAVLRDGRPHGNFAPTPALPRVQAIAALPVTSRNGTELPPYNTTYYFDQLIDHRNPSLGTFKQRYWHTWEYYEPGGPIILMTPGEGNAQGYDGYLTNRTINGQIANQQNGSTIVIEHRFYGLSNPYPDLSVKSLRVLNIQQAIDDFVYFANNVNLPMPNGDKLGPDNAPWLFVGGSYSGALTSWAMVSRPGTFWAGYSSSGVVEAILNYWTYFEPIRKNMPQNCSADIQAVISHIDTVFSGKNETAITELKDAFGMGEVTHLDDVAGALRNNLWDWQSLSPSTGPGAQFFLFCDALEVKDGVNAPVEGWGLEHALPAWSTYWKETYLPDLCGGDPVEECLGSYNATSEFYTDISVDNTWRSWFWQVCTQVGYLQSGPPPGVPAIVSRLIQPDYSLRQCSYMFPEAFHKPPRTNVELTNKIYKGWDVRLDRIFFANGIQDPWKEATISAEGLNVPSTPEMPIALSNGFHCSDLITRHGVSDATVGNVQKQALGSIRTWLTQWQPSEARKRSVVSRQESSIPVDSGPGLTLKPKPLNVWFRTPPEA